MRPPNVAAPGPTAPPDPALAPPHEPPATPPQPPARRRSRWRNLSLTDPLTRGDDVRRLQVALNRRSRLTGHGPMPVDGVFGAGTLRAARREGHLLGAADVHLTGPVRPHLQMIIRAPRRRTRREQARGKRRFIRRRVALARRRAGAPVRAGQSYGGDAGRRWRIGTREAPQLVWVDGRPVASWIAVLLRRARARGWRGRVVNGWRSYAHQHDIYYRQRLRPAALPGQSNHEGATYPRGAVDVTDWHGLQRALRVVPGGRRLRWYGPGDPVHFSATGR